MEKKSVRDRFKVVITGPNVTGKTALRLRFAGRDLPSCMIQPTFLCETEIVRYTDGEKTYYVDIFDTCGDFFRFLILHLKMKETLGVVFVFDITREDTFRELKDWIKQCSCHLDNCEVVIVGNQGVWQDRVGNQCGRQDRIKVVKTASGHKLAHEYGGTYFEVNTITNYNVQEAFDTVMKGAIARLERENFAHDSGGSIIGASARTIHNPLQAVGAVVKGAIATLKGKRGAYPEEISQDPYELRLYQKALLGGKEKDKSIRVNIVGNFRQGKSTLMRRLLGQQIKDIKSTDGIVVEHYKCNRGKNRKLRYTKTENTDNSDYVNRLVLVAKTQKIQGKSQPSHSTTHVLQEKSAEVDACISAFEGTNSDQTKMGQTLEGITSGIPQMNDIVSCVIETSGNSVLSSEEKSMFAKSLNANNESPKQDTQTVFDVWDYGGQYDYYATHTVFLSKRAIYLLVFDLSIGLNECVVDEFCSTESEGKDMKYFLYFWMNSIHSFVGSADGNLPKVILVGTHKDKVKGNKQEKERYITTYFEDIRQLFDGTNLSNHIHSDDFAVDNIDVKDPSLNALRETIITVGDEQSNTIEIPLKWIQLEKSLIARKHFKIIPIKSVMVIDLDHEFPLGDLEQVKLFLRYHHTKGTFVYFDEAPISEHVVLDPQYLIDAFKSIITSERFCTNDQSIRPFWKRLWAEGRLDTQLIDRQWGKPESKLKKFLDNKEILLSFLVKHHIISEASVFDEDTQQSQGLGWFVVPSMLRDISSKEEIQDFLRGKKQTKVCYVLLFGSSPIVQSIFHRLVSAALGRWPIAKAGKKTLIFKNTCIVRLRFDHCGFVELKHDSIEMKVVSLCPTRYVNGEQADSFRRFLEAALAFEFKKQRSDEDENISKPYTVHFRCNEDSHGVDGSERLISMEDLECGKVIPCPDLKTHEINVQQAREEWFQDNKNIIDVPDNELTDQLLSSIAQCIGENWQLLGIELGLSLIDVNRIVEDHPSGVVMRIYAMLQQSVQADADKANLKFLVETLRRCEYVHVDWDKLRNIVEDLKKETT